MASAKTPNNDAQIQAPPAPPHQGSWADQVEEDEDDPNWLQQELERENARNHAIKSGKRPRSENAQIQAPPVPPHQISWADQVEHDEDDPNWLQQELERENARIHAMKSGEPPCSQGPAVTATVEPAVSPHGTISDDQTLPIPSLSLEQPDGSLGLENIEENGLHEAIVSLLHQYGLHVEGDVSFHD
ncbi:hypothetical protein BDV97DRAFT_177127 [Delphinella strobiligena]|nr:hypothetical protein BDV97DRAFT_177127 [Delphinella strobiligena]